MFSESDINELKAIAWDCLAEYVWDTEMHNDKEKNMMDTHDFVHEFQGIESFITELIDGRKKEENK